MLYNEIRTLRSLGMKESDIAKSAKNYQGYTFTAVAGQTTQTLQVPGTAVVMLGIVVTGSGVAADDNFTLKLNNEVIAEAVPVIQADSTNSFAMGNGVGYQEYTRRMTGRDVLTVDYFSATGGIISYTVVYLTSYTSALRK